MNGVSRESFLEMDEHSKLNVLFDFAKESHKCACETTAQLQELKLKVERQKKIDTTVASIMGIVGGAASFFGTKLFGWR